MLHHERTSEANLVKVINHMPECIYMLSLWASKKTQ